MSENGHAESARWCRDCFEIVHSAPGDSTCPNCGGITFATEVKMPTTKKSGAKVRGTRGRKKGMNTTEKTYAGLLQSKIQAGEIIKFWFEGIKLRLADNTWFEIDFMVMNANCEVELHEVKAGWKQSDGSYKAGIQDDAWVKLKVAAETYPFRFFIVTVAKDSIIATEV